jgi:TPR repeat protein
MVFSAVFPTPQSTMRKRCFVTLLIALTVVIGVALRAQQATSVGGLPIAELQKLAETGDPAAQNELGVRYRLGADVEKDPAKAVTWYLKAARQGYTKAYFNLGAAYYNGDGVPVNTDNSCAYFIFASDAGDDRGSEALARTRREYSVKEMNRCEVLAATVYLKGDPIKQDYGKAIQWYMAAADAGDGVACERIAHLYDQGIGVTVDKQASLRWLERGSNLNYAPAVYELAAAYETGKGTTPDLAKARLLYERAASLAFVPAFAALGGMYKDGRGVPQDREKALAYYLVAASDADAKRNSDELSAQLTQKQVTNAKQMARKLALGTKSPVVLVRR